MNAICDGMHTTDDVPIPEARHLHDPLVEPTEINKRKSTARSKKVLLQNMTTKPLLPLFLQTPMFNSCFRRPHLFLFNSSQNLPLARKLNCVET